MLALAGANQARLRNTRGVGGQGSRTPVTKEPDTLQQKLTGQQEGFAQSIVAGDNQSDAYRANYGTSNMLPVTVNREACVLAANPNVAARIQELRQPAVDKLAWNQERFLDAAESQRLGAVADRQWAPANGALKLIGDATGLLSSNQQQDTGIQVTKITVILNTGVPDDGILLPVAKETRVIEGSKVDMEE